MTLHVMIPSIKIVEFLHIKPDIPRLEISLPHSPNLPTILSDCWDKKYLTFAQMVICLWTDSLHTVLMPCWSAVRSEKEAKGMHCPWIITTQFGQVCVPMVGAGGGGGGGGHMQYFDLNNVIDMEDDIVNVERENKTLLLAIYQFSEVARYTEHGKGKIIFS